MHTGDDMEAFGEDTQTRLLTAIFSGGDLSNGRFGFTKGRFTIDPVIK